MPAASDPNAIATEKRAFSAAHFSLLVDGQPNGLIKSIEGGGIKVDPITYTQGGPLKSAERYWKQLGRPKFDDIKLQIGMSASAPFYKWVVDFFAGTQTRKNGAILAGDFNYNVRAKRIFSEGLLREFTLPALDANGKDALYATVAIAVERIDYQPGAGGEKLDPQVKDTEKTKLWKQADFKFNLSGFDMTGVNKIEPITLKQNIIDYASGGLRAITKTPSTMEYPNISFTVPESHVKSLVDHFNEYGNASQKMKDFTSRIPEGSIEYLGSDGATKATLKLYQLEIFNIQPDKADSGTDNIKNVKVELFCEKMEFEYK